MNNGPTLALIIFHLFKLYLYFLFLYFLNFTLQFPYILIIMILIKKLLIKKIFQYSEEDFKVVRNVSINKWKFKLSSGGPLLFRVVLLILILNLFCSIPIWSNKKKTLDGRRT